MAESEYAEGQKLICSDCGRLCRVEIRNAEGSDKLVYLVYEDHRCNPAMLRFYNPESMHEGPFTRG